jgi:hypothetical protein
MMVGIFEIEHALGGEPAGILAFAGKSGGREEGQARSCQQIARFHGYPLFNDDIL